MIRHLAKRLTWAMVTLIAVYVITFFMVVMVPGKPFQQSDRNMPIEVERALRAQYSMDNNWLYFWEFLGGAVKMDFGPSFTYNDWTCTQIIAQALPISAMIGILAILLAILVGVPLGVISASRRNTWMDVSIVSGVLIGISLPTFVTGAALLTVFSVAWPILPIGGWGTWQHLPLPVITLSLPFIAYICRLTRMAMLDALSSDYIRTAIAKGVSPHDVLWTHALKVAFLPVLSYVGPATAQAVTGSFVVEKVFGVPGMGQHFVNAALNADVGLIMSTVLVFSVLLISLNVVIDVLYAWLDPRITMAF